jgi:uncharacterized iron-regulated membrane protein
VTDKPKIPFKTIQAFLARLPLNSLITRTAWIKVHVYLGLSLGLLLAVIGLTGSFCVYGDAWDEFFNPRLYIAETQAPMLSPDKIFAAVRAAHPQRNGEWTLEMPRTPHSPIVGWFEKPAETAGAFYAPLMVAVNPYSGEVLDSRFWGRTLASQIIDLHTDFAMEGGGRKLLAWLAAILILSVISGVYLWWPERAKLAAAFSVRHDAGLMRFLFDLHRLSGLAGAGLLLVLAFTGFHLAYPPLLEKLTASAGMGHGDAGPNVRSTAVPNDRPVNLQEAVLIARGPFPSSEVRRITTPRGETGTYRINLRQRQEINQHHPMTNVWVDRWSGQIRDVQNPEKFSAGQRFTLWMWPLHTGEAFGAGVRFLWFLAGLLPAFLFVTGLWHWLFRRGMAADRPLDLPGLKRKFFMLSRQAYACAAAWLKRLQPKLAAAIKQLNDWMRRYTKS